MKIIVNTIPLLSKITGVGRYLFNIVDNIKKIDKKNEYYFYYGIGVSEKVFFNDINLFDLLPWREYRFFSKFGQKIVKQKNKIFLFNRLLETSLGQKVDRIFRYVLKTYVRPLFTFENFYDLYFEPNFIPLQEIKSKKVVTTIHDFSFYLYPQWHPKDRILYFSKYFWRNIYRSDVIITVSEFIKHQAQQFIKGYKGEILYIYNGYDNHIFKTIDKNTIKKYSAEKFLPQNFILFVGSLEPRKNLIRLLEAYKLLPENIKKEIKLVIAGFHGWKNVEAKKLLSQLKKNVVYLGYVEDYELAFLYNLALASVYPSLYEGFGLPNIESMACGCPVITSEIPAIKEVCKDAVYYVDPYSVESIKEGLIRVIEDSQLRDTLRQKGLQHVKNFRWEISAKKHLEVFSKI